MCSSDLPIKIIVSIFEKPGIRLRTFYQVIAKDRDVLCARAQVTLFFMDENTRKPTRAPSYFSEKFDAAVQLANSK